MPITQEPEKYTVITKELILTSANEQQASSRRRRVITKLDKIEDLRLAFMNILTIDFLWPLKNLVKLKLNNNAIEKIENLEKLKKLRELDLSFNRIRVMENLNHLASLEVLSLYHNEIEIIEGIDKLQQLTILSLGSNKIKGKEHVLELRKLKKLQSLQMSGNPCAEDPGYKNYLFAYVPQLVYFAYKIITEEEKKEALAEHGRSIAGLIERERKEEREITELKLIEANNDRLNNAFVEYLNDDALFQLMFSKDEEGQIFSKLNEDCETVFIQYKEKFVGITSQLYDFGMKEHQNRGTEADSLIAVTSSLLTKVTKKARQVMETVKGKRLEIQVRITQILKETAMLGEVEDEVVDHIDDMAKKLSDEYREFISSIWATLMHDETVVHDQIEEMNAIFEQNITDMVNGFLENSQDFFAQLRSGESEYYENISTHVLSYANTVEDDEKHPFFLQFSEDKDGLNNSLANSHFSHMQTIDDREDRLNTRLKNWLNTQIKKIKDDEIARNRSKVMEIKHFLDYQRDSMSVSKLLGLAESDESDGSEKNEPESEADN